MSPEIGMHREHECFDAAQLRTITKVMAGFSHILKAVCLPISCSCHICLIRAFPGEDLRC